MYKDTADLDLNAARIRTDCGQGERLTDNSLTSGKVTAYFKDLEAQFVRHVHDADAVMGCMAWLTNKSLLRSLAEPRCGVQIIVQKEDFLRPDGRDWDVLNHKVELRMAYDRLRPIPHRMTAPGKVSQMSYCGSEEIHGVRCVGNYNKSRKSAFPRMHNKFMVFCRANVVYHEETDMDLVRWWENGQILRVDYTPYAVWTGSFNFSENATKSFENAVVIEDEKIAEAYCEEWSQIAALSEPLDWESEWIAPEWRIGT